MQDFPQTKIQKLRAAMWAEHYKKGMSFSEVCELNFKIANRYPKTEEERREKTESLMRTPEFVL